MMLQQTLFQFDIIPIVRQVREMGNFDRSLLLNETKGNLLSGHYTVKPEYVATPLGVVLTTLGDIGEARLLKLNPEDVYTAHTDPDDRYHMSITTTPYSYLADLDKCTLHHLPVDGSIWYMDTSIMHSAINLGGGDERIHLNIRVRLPAISKPCYSIRFEDAGKYDWKQMLYNTMMGYINVAIKNKQVTGIERISEREMHINCNSTVLIALQKRIEAGGFKLIVEECN
jgi:hypothetical protein